jgi:hypothetical protein
MPKVAEFKLEGAEARAEQLAIAVALADLGARPRVITHLAGVADKDAKLIYTERNGKAASPGALPYSADAILKNDSQRLHAAILVGKYAQLRKLALRHVDAFIKSYAWYDAQFGRDVISIDQFDHLVKLTELKRAHLLRCEACESLMFVTKPGLCKCSACKKLKAVGLIPKRRRSTRFISVQEFREGKQAA